MDKFKNMKIELEYYGGDGFGGCKENDFYTIKSDEGDIEFNDFSKAKKYYDKLFCAKAFWNRNELLDAYTVKKI